MGISWNKAQEECLVPLVLLNALSWPSTWSFGEILQLLPSAREPSFLKHKEVGMLWLTGSIHPARQFILTVIGRLFTAFPGVQCQLESGFLMVSHLILSNYIQAGGTYTCKNCSPINTSLKRLIYLLEAS